MRGRARVLAQSGFVLVATLWILAVLAIGAGYLSAWTSEALNQAYQQRQQIEAAIAMEDTRAVIFYLLGSHRLTEAGLALPVAKAPFAPGLRSNDPFQRVSLTGPSLRLDDRGYRGTRDVLFSIQDEAGLIGVNSRSLFLLDNWLGLKGIAFNDRAMLLARFQDYVDQDPLYRLNGAEEPQYVKAGMPPPANRPLLNPRELQAILGWEALEGLWTAPEVSRMVNTIWNSFPNLNTAPREVLRSWAVFNSGEIDRIIELRSLLPFRTFRDLKKALGRSPALSEIGLRFLPGQYLRITLWSESAGLAREIHVQLTPLADNGSPWLVDHDIVFAVTQLPAREPPSAHDIVLFSEDPVAEKSVSVN